MSQPPSTYVCVCVCVCVCARVCVHVCMCVYGTLACTRDLFSNIIHVDNALFLQLKNMINALFSSQHGGAKCFQFEGVEFGWQAIIDMYHHECQRRSNGLARMVPHLREIPVLRDAWTKLISTLQKSCSYVSPNSFMHVYYMYVLLLEYSGHY